MARLDVRALAASAALIAIFFASFTHALTLEGPNGIAQACAGQTAQLQYNLWNNGNDPAVIDTSLEGTNWATSSLAPSFLNLRPQERANLLLAITPALDSKPGQYIALVNAESRTGETATSQLQFSVKDCSNLTIDVEGPSTLYACTSARYMITLHNPGPYSAFGQLESDLNPALATFGEQPYVVLPRSSKQISLYFNVPCDVLPQKIFFTISARSAYDGTLKAQYTSLLEAKQPPVTTPIPTPTPTPSVSPTTGFFTAGFTPFAVLIAVLLLVAFTFWAGRQIKVKKQAEEAAKEGPTLRVKVYRDDAPVRKLKLRAPRGKVGKNG